jgi:hypothetical protein
MNTETQFNDESKDLPTFMASGYAGNFTESFFETKEISDQDIKRGIKKSWNYINYQERHWMVEGAKWYREQLKKKNQ